MAATLSPQLQLQLQLRLQPMPRLLIDLEKVK